MCDLIQWQFEPTTLPEGITVPLLSALVNATLVTQFWLGLCALDTYTRQPLLRVSNSCQPRLPETGSFTKAASLYADITYPDALVSAQSRQTLWWFEWDTFRCQARVDDTHTTLTISYGPTLSHTFPMFTAPANVTWLWEWDPIAGDFNVSLNEQRVRFPWPPPPLLLSNTLHVPTNGKLDTQMNAHVAKIGTMEDAALLNLVDLSESTECAWVWHNTTQFRGEQVYQTFSLSKLLECTDPSQASVVPLHYQVQVSDQVHACQVLAPASSPPPSPESL